MYHCAWLVDQQRSWDDAVREVSMLKALTGELVNEVVLDLPAVPRRHGLHARNARSSGSWRDARVLAIGGGATEVMLEEVAKRWQPA